MLLAMSALVLIFVPKFIKWVGLHFHPAVCLVSEQAAPSPPPRRHRIRPKITLLNVHPPLSRSSTMRSTPAEDIEMRTMRRGGVDDTAL